MNIFLYDEYTDKYKRKIKKTEEELNKLNLQGKIIYLKNVKNLKEVLLEEINNGAKTIISVGNNLTINNVVNVLANISRNIPIALIPIGPNNSIAESMGVFNEKDACFILSSRRIENIMLAQANEKYFIENSFIKNNRSRLYINNSFKILTNKPGNIFLYNISPKKYIKKNLVNPKNELINVYIKTGLKHETHFSSKNLEIKNEKEILLLDNSTEVALPAKIKISKKAISFIVGKERYF